MDQRIECGWIADDPVENEGCFAHLCADHGGMERVILARARFAKMRSSAGIACMTFGTRQPVKPSWRARTCPTGRQAARSSVAPEDRGIRPPCRRSSGRGGGEGRESHCESDKSRLRAAVSPRGSSTVLTGFRVSADWTRRQSSDNPKLPPFFNMGYREVPHIAGSPTMARTIWAFWAAAVLIETY